jgi:HTH-type transcriptional regulator/antitoxin HigA
MTKVIKTEPEYRAALATIEELIDGDAAEGTPNADRLEVLSVLVHDYESRRVSASLPDPIDAIRFRMEQENLTQRDLIPFIGSRGKVSEVLSGKRPLTLSMIRALHANLGIPAKVLLQERDASILREDVVEWNRFPVRQIVSRGWISTRISDVADQAEEVVRDFFGQLGGVVPAAALFRKSDHIRSARSMDEYALAAWSARILIRAHQDPPSVPFEAGSVNQDFMREVARLSWSDSGPLLAQEYLRKRGIPLIIEPHLPRTYLDGAAILLELDRPVIGLSIRHDRLDNFWFCLMHELAHIALHLEAGVSRFFDDLDVEGKGDVREEQADQLAGEALIPTAEWAKSAASRLRTAQAAERLARKLGISPAIVAGRIRHQYNSYRILNQLVGHKQVRKLFTDVEWSS